MNSNKVEVKQGGLKGVLFATENNYEYFGFMGVPYAKPPIGDLRFKAPQPAESWEGIRDATVDETVCPQINMSTGEVWGKEDCLFLNVYAPKVMSPRSKLPVMVYIHGGLFVFGNGTIKDEQGPDYLIERDVVVVTINYRLGIFGFLCLDIPEAQGNMGLKDQVEALKWVQENIASFGGDADNVTIFGLSAGAASVDYLLVSPMANGLFHKGISQSGAAVNHWARSYGIKGLALKVAKHMGYQGEDDSAALHKFLLDKPAEELVQKSFEIIEVVNDKGLYFGFVPTIEKELTGTDAFLTKNPYRLLKNGQFNKVPVIRGFCNFEGLLMHAMKPFVVERVLEQKILAKCLPYKIEFSQSVNEELKTIYMDVAATNPGDDRDASALKFFSDLDFVGGVWNCGKAIAEHNVPVYLYKFAYDGGMNFIKRMFGIMRPGAAHGDDMPYLLHMKDMIKFRTEIDKIVCTHFAIMWTNFAKTGDPNPVNDDGTTKWLPFTRFQKNYLHIDDVLTFRNNYEPQRMAFFEDLYDKYEK